jgi:hypothetical protein
MHRGRAIGMARDHEVRREIERQIVFRIVEGFPMARPAHGVHDDIMAAEQIGKRRHVLDATRDELDSPGHRGKIGRIAGRPRQQTIDGDDAKATRAR